MEQKSTVDISCVKKNVKIMTYNTILQSYDLQYYLTILYIYIYIVRKYCKS